MDIGWGKTPGPWVYHPDVLSTVKHCGDAFHRAVVNFLIGWW